MNRLMKFDPMDGSEKPYPSEAVQYRGWHGRVAWLFNPWTGEKRHPADIGSDVTGLLIRAPGEVLKQAKLLPVHPSFRCTTRPVIDTEEQAGCKARQYSDQVQCAAQQGGQGQRAI